MDYISVSPPPIHMLTHYLYCEDLEDEAYGGWWGHKGGALKRDISDFIEETPESSLTLSSRRTQWEDAIYGPGRGSSWGTDAAGIVTLD